MHLGYGTTWALTNVYSGTSGGELSKYLFSEHFAPPPIENALFITS